MSPFLHINITFQYSQSLQKPLCVRNLIPHLCHYLKPANTSPQSKLWVFTPDLIYSTSEDREPRRSMKIFYRTVSDPTTKTETTADSKIEEMPLPQYVIRQLLLDLKVSTNVLPQSARTHQSWTIGLLER